ncbi:DUF2569 family protein [Mesorhizobium sp. 43Arga]
MWHWAILLLLIGVPVFFAVRSARKRPRPPKDLEGFGGWLMLLAIGQSLSPLRTLLELARSVKDYQRLITLPNGPLAVYGETALNLAFLVLQLVVLISMLRRSQHFPKLFICQWFAIPILFILDTVWISRTLSIPMSQLLDGDTLISAVIAVATTGLWAAYVYRSVRVRNTFGGDTAAIQAATFS